MKETIACKVKCGDVVAINGRLGYTRLNPCGHLVVDKEIENGKVILTISGWSGDFIIKYDFDEIVEIDN